MVRCADTVGSTVVNEITHSQALLHSAVGIRIADGCAKLSAGSPEHKEIKGTRLWEESNESSIARGAYSLSVFAIEGFLSCRAAERIRSVQRTHYPRLAMLRNNLLTNVSENRLCTVRTQHRQLNRMSTNLVARPSASNSSRRPRRCLSPKQPGTIPYSSIWNTRCCPKEMPVDCARPPSLLASLLL